jgi:ribosomal-protein-alanine N-acetyltransferase
VDLPIATQFIVEAQEWSPTIQTFVDPIDALNMPGSLWLSAFNGENLMGIIGFTGISWPDGSANVALGVVPAWRGKGVAKLLATHQNDYAFQDLGLRRLQMTALEDSPSCRIAKAAGLTYEGTLRKCRLKRGTYHNASIYSLLKEG